MFKLLIKQKVSTVEKAVQPLEEISMRSSIEQLVGGPIESCSDFAKSVVGERLVQLSEKATKAERFRHLVRSKGLVRVPHAGGIVAPNLMLGTDTHVVDRLCDVTEYVGINPIGKVAADRRRIFTEAFDVHQCVITNFNHRRNRIKISGTNNIGRESAIEITA